MSGVSGRINSGISEDSVYADWKTLTEKNTEEHRVEQVPRGIGGEDSIGKTERGKRTSIEQLKSVCVL